MVGVFLVSLTMSLESLCLSAVDEYASGITPSSDIATHVCAKAVEKEDSSKASLALFNIYSKKDDAETAAYWLWRAKDEPKAAKILAERFESRQKLHEAVFFWTKSGNGERAAEICLSANIDAPKETLHILRNKGSGKAYWLLGRLLLKNPNQKNEALSYFEKAVQKGYTKAKPWNEWLQGKIPSTYDKNLLLEIADSPETQNNKELVTFLLDKAIALQLSNTIKQYASEISKLSPEKQDKAYDLLSMYPEYARMNAVRKQKVGRKNEALQLMEQAAFLGDMQAVFFEVMNKEPTDIAGRRKKARILSRILFSKESIPDSIRQTSAEWLAFFFIDNKAAEPDIPLACDMAKKAKLTEEKALLFADTLLLNGSVDTAREWLIIAQQTKNTDLLYQLGRRWKSLKDTKRWIEVMTSAAELGHTKALLELGRYELANGKEASGLLRISAAADKSDPEALYLRGMFGLQRKIPRSDDEIVEDLILALAGGKGEAGVELSKMAAKGSYMPKDPKESARFAHLAAKAGSRDGMRIFGIYAIKGYGMHADRNLAKQWLFEAADRGDSEAITICREEGFEEIEKPVPLLKNKNRK